MKENINKILKEKNIIYILILIVVATIAALPLLSSKLDVYTDDGIQHIARSFGTYEAIKNKVCFGNIIPSFSNGFGYSWNLFYGSFTTIGIIIFRIISGSYIIGYKLFAYICLLCSGIFMYKFVSSISENKNVGLLAGALYIIAPYHLTDLYIRNAIAEFASFMFIPLVFWGLYNIVNKEKNSYYLILGTVGLIFTHNISTLYTAIFAFIYLVINIKSLKRKEVIKHLVINLIFIIIISSCFILPLLETKFSAEYRVYEEEAMASEESIVEQQLPIRRVFVTADNEGFVFELGPYMIIMLGFSVMTVRILKKEFRKDYLFFLITGLISLIMATKMFPWKIMTKTLYIIQFPWRCLEFSSFFFSIVAAINMGALIKKYSFKDSIIIITIAIVYTIALGGFVRYTDNVGNIEEYSLGHISGMDNECIAGMGRAEYLPTKAYENRFYIATRENNIYVLTGKAIIENENKTLQEMTANIKTLEEETVFELPYVYYPGYEIRADGIIVENFETENGLLGFKLNNNDSITLEVKYKGTKIMKISMIFSLLGFIVFCIYVLKNRNKEN